MLAATHSIRLRTVRQKCKRYSTLSDHATHGCVPAMGVRSSVGSKGFFFLWEGLAYSWTLDRGGDMFAPIGALRVYPHTALARCLFSSVYCCRGTQCGRRFCCSSGSKRKNARHKQLYRSSHSRSPLPTPPPPPPGCFDFAVQRRAIKAIDYYCTTDSL